MLYSYILWDPHSSSLSFPVSTRIWSRDVPSVARAKADADVPAWRERVEKKKNKDGKKREVQEEKEEEEEEHGSGKKEEEREWRGGRAGEREIVPR